MNEAFEWKFVSEPESWKNNISTIMKQKKRMAKI